MKVRAGVDFACQSAPGITGQLQAVR